MQDEQRTPRGSQQSSDAAVPESVFSTDSRKKLVAFEIAELAKKQVTDWAKWIVGMLLALTATLGVKTYLDVHSGIKTATEDQIRVARQKADTAIANFQREQDEALASFRKKSEETIAQMQQTLDSVRKTGLETEVAILALIKEKPSGLPPTRTVARKGRQRPIGPGISVGSLSGSTGSICCVVRSPNGTRSILVASYLVEDADKSEARTIIQPGGPDGGGTVDNTVGTLDRLTSTAALVRLRDGIDVYTDVPEIGKINGVAEPKLGEAVRKFGRTTGLTRGTVTQVDATIQLALSAHGLQRIACFVVTPVGEKFSEGGDGGAPVVNTSGQLVGMHFAGTGPSQEGQKSYVVPIKPILAELDVEVVSEP